jgi:hypothetical protein
MTTMFLLPCAHCSAEARATLHYGTRMLRGFTVACASCGERRDAALGLVDNMIMTVVVVAPFIGAIVGFGGLGLTASTSTMQVAYAAGFAGSLWLGLWLGYRVLRLRMNLAADLNRPNSLR